MIGKTNAISGVSAPVPKIRTVSGSVISVSDALAMPAVSLIADINAVQNLNGYDSPWPAGGGKNKFDPSEAQNNKWVNSSTGAIENVNGYWVTGYIPVTSGDVVRCPTKGSARNAWYNTDKSQATYVSYSGAGNGITAPADGFIVLTVKESNFPFGSDSEFVVTRNDADLTYAPYSNICPISGWSNVNVYREAQYDAGATPYATINLNGTVYGGSLDVTTGVLTVTHGFITLVGGNEATYSNNGHTINSTRCIVTISGKANGVDNMTSNRFAYTNSGDYYGRMLGRAASNNVEFYLPPSVSTNVADQKAWFADNPTEVCFELATPQTVQLSPTTVRMLAGNNTLWANSGDSELQYWARR